MSKLIMLYHEPTDTHWINDNNWKQRYKNESILYGDVEIDTDDFKSLYLTMKYDGYEFVSNNEIPFRHLGKIKPDMVYEDGINLIYFE